MNPKFLALMFSYLIANQGLAADAGYCQRLVAKYASAATEFLAQYGTSSSVAADHPLEKLRRYSSSSCERRFSSAVDEITELLSLHSNKIGIVLPLTGPLSANGKDLLNAINLSLANSELKDRIIVRDTQSNPADEERLFAELVLKDNVTLVVGGLQTTGAQRIKYWSERLAIPSILLSPAPRPLKPGNFAIHIFPTAAQLSSTLTKYAQTRGLSKLAILSPQGPVNDSINLDIAEAANANGISITEIQSYTPSDYASMETAAKKLLRISTPERANELRQMVAKQKARARKEGVKFNPDMIQLAPLVSFDALFIPDNFKNVRHIAQILKFLGLKATVLCGLQEWRSQSLVEPWDSFFEGSFFVDFIKLYSEIPAPLRPPTLSPFLAKLDDAQAADFRVIGWRVGDLLSRVWPNVGKRYKLSSQILKLSDNQVPLFGNGPAFLANQSSRWPTTVFQVNAGTINPM